MDTSTEKNCYLKACLLIIMCQCDSSPHYLFKNRQKCVEIWFISQQKLKIKSTFIIKDTIALKVAVLVRFCTLVLRQISLVPLAGNSLCVFCKFKKKADLYFSFLLSFFFFFFLQPLSLIVSGRNHLPAHPPSSWCEVMLRSCICLFSVQKPSKSDLCSCRRHLAAPSKETPERIKTCPRGKMRCPHGSLRIIVGMIIYVLFYSGSKYINTPVTIMASYFLFCLQS